MYVILKCYKDDKMVLICLKNIRLVEYSLWFCLNKKEYKVQNGYYIDDYSENYVFNLVECKFV